MLAESSWANCAKMQCRGRYTNIEFQVVMEVAKMELMNFVGKDALLAAKKPTS